jgi:hypothetical protein
MVHFSFELAGRRVHVSPGFKTADPLPARRQDRAGDTNLGKEVFYIEYS